MSQCQAPGCRTTAAPTTPVALCAAHATAVADWVAESVGVTDVLPYPCVACGSRLGVRYPSGWLCAVCEWRHGELPDSDLAAVRVDVVYYLRAGDRIKIGTTTSPRQRFAALGHRDVVAFERGDRRLEQRRHEQFAAQRFAGSEWFAVSRELLDHIEVLAGGVDPWDRYARWVSEAVAARG